MPVYWNKIGYYTFFTPMNKTVLIALVIIVLAAGGYLLLQNSKNQEGTQPATAPAAQPSAMEEKQEGTQAGENEKGEKYEVKIKNFAFTPAEMKIKVGETVTWTNEDSAPHTATASDGSFDSKNLSQGQSFSFTFDKAGTYDYICSVHPSMKAKVIVE